MSKADHVARVLAGVLTATRSRVDEVTPETLIEVLGGEIGWSSLWMPGPITGGDAGVVAYLDAAMRPVARWAAPGADLVDAVATILGSTGVTLQTPVPGWGRPVLRLAVGSLDDAKALSQLKSVAGIRLVPHVSRAAHRSSWRWPLRVGVVAGPGAAEQSRELASDLSELFSVSVVDSSSEPVELEILVLSDGDCPVPDGVWAACLVLPGVHTSDGIIQALDRLHQSDPAAVVLTPSSDLTWFTEMINQLARDEPLDVAVGLSVAGAVVVSDYAFLSLTPLRLWALRVANALDNFDPGSVIDGLPVDAVVRELRSFAETSAGHTKTWEPFMVPDEAIGAGFAEAIRGVLSHHMVIRGGKIANYHPYPPTPWNANPRDIYGTPGPYEDAVQNTPIFEENTRENFKGIDIMRAVRSFDPDLVDFAKTPATSTKPRQLFTDLYEGNARRTRALAPYRRHRLEVQIRQARAKDIQIAGMTGIPEELLPESDGYAGLKVDVTCEQLRLHQVRDIALSTVDRTEASGVAEIEFDTEGIGDLVFRIDVLYKGRPLMGAALMATVSDRTRRRDRVKAVAIPFTTDPEPTPILTAADVTLRQELPELRRLGTPEDLRARLPEVDRLLNFVEVRASSLLGHDDAPSSFQDRAGMEVLIELARYGAQLRVYTEPLKIGDASVISLTVDPSDPVVPLELVYDGEAPGWDAKLCTAAHGAGSCRRASAAVVCPYAFWGLTRTIARAIERRDANPNTHKPRSLDLRPVLYAAADRADDHAPPNEKPSDLLRAALETFAGADSLTQVRTWALWTSSVSSKRPELLVVLGHTETLRDEVNLEIGKGEFLARPEVEARFIGMQGAAPPLVVLIACATAASGDMWAGLPTAFASKGAAAVVATLTKLNGAQGALAAAQVVGALRATTDGQQRLLGAALRTARRDLVSQGLLVGLLLVSHGEIDVQLTKT